MCAAQCASYHDAAVLGAAGDDVVVVGAELDVQDGSRVAAHGGVVHVDTARLQRPQRVSSQVAQLLRGRKSLNLSGDCCPLTVINSISKDLRLIKMKIKITEDLRGRGLGCT